MVWIPQYGRNVQLKELEEKYAPIYESVLNIGGSTMSILPLGDIHHYSALNKFKTIGGEQVEFTWSEAIESFDTPFDRTSPDSYQGIIPFVDFNGTDEWASTPDAAYWSNNDDNTEPWSLGAWIQIAATSTTRSILSKFGANGTKEWDWRVSASEDLILNIDDDTGSANIQQVTDVALSTGRWVFVVSTYNSVGGANAETGMKNYVDGVLVASTASKSGSYGRMQDLASLVYLGARERNSVSQEFGTRIAGASQGPWFTLVELSADAILRLFEIGRRALSL